MSTCSVASTRALILSQNEVSGASAATMRNPSLPWHRLIEGSDSIGRFAVKIADYKDTAAGFGVAAAHVAALRHSGTSCSLRPRRDPEYPFGLFVNRKQIGQAKAIIAHVGLGADTST